jgi:hypothetical protein
MADLVFNRRSEFTKDDVPHYPAICDLITLLLTVCGLSIKEAFYEKQMTHLIFYGKSKHFYPHNVFKDENGLIVPYVEFQHITYSVELRIKSVYKARITLIRKGNDKGCSYSESSFPEYNNYTSQLLEFESFFKEGWRKPLLLYKDDDDDTAKIQL